ncbi:hypothetical protein GOODEAATRI_005651 [Goodea atripinnis]|uniref:C2H2-type domain-containing protein n=1 Tax=Goodea atripinnis TaxID=208336 RepID=A0ABV0MFD0_9TELE
MLSLIKRCRLLCDHACPLRQSWSDMKAHEAKSHWLHKDPRCALVYCFYTWTFLRLLNYLRQPRHSTKRGPSLQLPLPAYYVFNESLTVSKWNRQVMEWQITPMRMQALDDYHSNLTTGSGSCNLPAETNTKFFYFFLTP